MDLFKRFSPASTGHDEPEEQFVLTIYEVSGNGSIDGLRSNITITIAKHGFPNGVFRFQNTATQTFTEPTNVGLSEHFTVVRNQGTQGTVNVSEIKGNRCVWVPGGITRANEFNETITAYLCLL